MSQQEKIYHIFNQINSSGLRYFQFKGNTNLDNSFSGKSDFDIIVHEDDFEKFEDLILNIGFKRRCSSSNKFEFDIEDYLFYDEDLEEIYHFQIHKRILFGDILPNEFYLNNINFWFRSYYLDKQYPIYRVIPELEVILVTFKLLLKNRLKQSIKNSIKILIGRNLTEDKHLLKYQVLINLFDLNKLKEILDKEYPEFYDVIIDFYNAFKANRLNFNYQLSLKSRLISILRKSKNNNYKIESKKYEVNKFKNRISSCGSPNNGKVISLIGPDGAGKTTLSKDIENWLSYKLSSENIFLGQVKDSKFNWVLRKISRILRLFRLSKLSVIARDYTHIVNAGYREYAINQCKVLSDSGYYIITDRYPLKEFWNMKIPMDGPKLPEESIFHRKEFDVYKKFPDYPDIIIILKIPIEVSISRKPDEHNNPSIIHNISKKMEAIDNLHNLKDSIIIDATKEYSEVLKSVKSFIWGKI